MVKDRELIALAAEARAKAYAPYSNYRVGAALLVASGQVHTGVNVENASYGLAICAERTAAVKAVTAGDREFVAIAVVTENGGSPCGACRQVLAEVGPQMRVVLADAAGKSRTYRLSDLLPDSFGPANLPQK
jgi:cytidine deaminase